MARFHSAELKMTIDLNSLREYPNPSLEEPPTPKRSRVEDPWYDCEFVHTPPDELVCPVCNRVAQRAYQKNCCGRLFCKTCLKQLIGDDVCPDCSGRPFKDVRGEQAIQSLLVKCRNTANGCDWQGDLHSLNEHDSTCGFALIPCPNKCTQSSGKMCQQILRKDLECHLDECPNRKYKCPHCGVYGKHAKMTTTHLNVCTQKLLDCPNLCGEMVKRCKLGEHRSTCPMEKVDCKYVEICNTKWPRRYVTEHECNNNLHLSLAINSIVKLKQLVVNPFRQQVFKMSRFRSCQSFEEKWYSGSFYSHDKGGYKMCVSVQSMPRGYRYVAFHHYVLIFVHLMHSKNDSDLVWPFRGSVTIQLLNQIRDKNHLTMLASYDNEFEDEYNKRVHEGKGKGRLINTLKLAELDYNAEKECQYLKDDCLVLRVSSVEVHNHNKPWLTPH